MARIDYYNINALNCKIFEPENYEKRANSRFFFGFSDDRTDLIERMADRSNILNSMERNIRNYNSGAVMTTSGQDMSYYQQQRANHYESCRDAALSGLRKEFIRIIENCKKVLIEYDMLEEFKKYNPMFADYFDLKNTDITWKMINLDLDNFIIETKKCALCPEANNKRIKKEKNRHELIEKKRNEEMELLYKKEFECVKLFEVIEKNKMKSNVLYLEYKKIAELKDKYKPNKGFLKNTMFLEYFTDEKNIYLNNLLET